MEPDAAAAHLARHSSAASGGVWLGEGSGGGPCSGAGSSARADAPAPPRRGGAPEIRAAQIVQPLPMPLPGKHLCHGVLRYARCLLASAQGHEAAIGTSVVDLSGYSQKKNLGVVSFTARYSEIRHLVRGSRVVLAGGCIAAPGVASGALAL